MRWHSLLGSCGFVVAAGLFLSGCGKSTTATFAEVGREQLTDLWDMYQTYAQAKGKPPAGANDLRPQAAGAPTGERVLTDPNFVVLYGTPVRSEERRVGKECRWRGTTRAGA